MHNHAQDRTKEAVRVTWIGAIFDAILGVSKIIVGVLFFSHALIADGIHSLSDLITDFMVVVIVKIAHAEPDEEHPYGHERFETLGTVVLGCLLVAVAGAMAYDSGLNLLDPSEKNVPGWPALVIAFASIAIKEALFRYTLAIGKRIKSDLLIANAWHSRTDAYSSIIVFIGIAGSMMGIIWLDSLAALGVAIFVAKIGWELSWKSIQELVDTAIPPEELSAITASAKEVAGIEDVHSFKSRQMGPKMLLEMHLQVKPYVSVSEGHYIGDSVVAKLLREFDSIGHIIFHIDTENDDKRNSCMVLPFRAEITDIVDHLLENLAPELTRQNITLHYLHGKIEIDLFITPPPSSQIDITAINQSQLSEQLNEHLMKYTWHQHLNLWLAI
ncbi:cation diffusion facilitator family transporter [Motiliproteus sp. MSK22-1]|uniref:cation diffusion facilitator family transporter n=1 Tax=Motiliproteus sp. MSK22-1 TaxID=1897630 RepID=UPI000975E890|nr:cation diffusion facilitator family transporter [Motiliproteus sp. MSK22-1]OMH38762.1 metal transporter [Motiliproteus sp. MSK22-1]